MTRPDPTPHELEAHLEARLRKAVRMIGGRLIKLAPTETGTPDRLVLLPGGRMYLVELKTNVGRLSAAQELWHQRARELGTDVTVLKGRYEIEAWIRKQAGYFDPQPKRGRYVAPHRRKDAAKEPAPAT